MEQGQGSYPKLDVLRNKVLRIHTDGGASVGLKQLVIVVEITSFVTPLYNCFISAVAPERDVWFRHVDDYLLPEVSNA